MSERLLVFTTLYILERKRLLRIIRRIVGNTDVAEDIAQDAYLKLSHRTVGSADKGLLFRTAQNLARDHIRARRIRENHARAVQFEAPDQGRHVADRSIESREQLGSLISALESLPRRTQQIFLLNRVDGMSQLEIARALGLSISTIEKEMMRAIAFCREWQRQNEL